MTNQEIFEEACQYIPGGVNSPVRAFKSVGEIPVLQKKVIRRICLVKMELNILIIFVLGDHLF